MGSRGPRMHELRRFLEPRNHFSELIKSICPVCFKMITGALRESENGLFMEKICAEHGMFRTTIGTDLQTYKELCWSERKVTQPREYGVPSKRGCPEDCGLCPAHEQHTCLAILEITSRCELRCPVCLARSCPEGEDLNLYQIEYALRRLRDYEGGLTPIQISGGEPTLHPQLTNIVNLARSYGFHSVELNTNGLALSRDQALAESLIETGLSSVYLQMDTLDPTVSKFIRGKNLVETKMKAVDNCLKAGLEVILSVTIVPGVNDQELWTMVRFGLENEITGVNFQALTLTGRYPKEVGDGEDHFTGGHFLKEIIRQSQGELLEGDLSPIPCPDPRCGLILYGLVQNGALLPLNRLLERDTLIDCLADLKDWPQTLRHILSSSCGSGCSKQNLEAFSDTLSHSDFFSVGYHGMMDAYGMDLERVKRCCVHEITAKGKLIPFCLYNIKYR